jgi:acetyltransferase-like isoleucine patch superfamily enzyme
MPVASGRRITLANLSALRRYLWLRLRHRNVQGERFFMDRGASVHVDEAAEVRFGRGVYISRDFTGWFAGRVVIGDFVWFSRGCTLAGYESVEIGDHCVFGELVSIHDSDHRVGPPGSLRSPNAHAQPVRIGSRVWVGAKTTIVRGVSIGDDATVGANSVVTRDVPDGAVVAGAPARVVAHPEATRSAH